MSALRLYHLHPRTTTPRLMLAVIEMHELHLIPPADIARELDMSYCTVSNIISRYYASNRRIIIPSRINDMKP